MTKYKVYHEHNLLPWVIEAAYFKPGTVLINPGTSPRPWLRDAKPTPPTHINDGVLRFYDGANMIAAFPLGEWVFVTEVGEDTDANPA